LAATGAGSLIIKEAARFPAEGMSCAAFRHGPMEMASPEVYVLVYEGTGQTSALNAGLVADIQKAGGRSVLVGPGSGDDVFRIPPVSVEGLPVLEILPAQMLSLALALQQGHAPGQFVNASKVTSSE
jgi:glucosamine--fructose-6-phosphate aminotransferase (isomerizing)